jgi:CRP-like cAMP-binding protein
MMNKLLFELEQFMDKNEKYRGLLEEISIPAKTTLLREGEISKHIYFVKQGVLRLWANNNGEDITFRFCLEGEAVSSFLGNEPSMFTIESIESSTVILLAICDFEMLLQEMPEYKDKIIKLTIKRLTSYAQLFLSRIKNNPEERYLDLMKNNPEILLRVPQHYIATYLGITPVSLSRIRNRVMKIKK